MRPALLLSVLVALGACGRSEPLRVAPVAPAPPPPPPHVTLPTAPAPTPVAPAPVASVARPKIRIPAARASAPSWTRASDIALTASSTPVRSRRLADKGDWAATSRDGRHAVVGRTYRNGGVADRELGRAKLLPGGKDLPVGVIDDEGAIFSPDDRHLLIRSESHAWKPAPGAAWHTARPQITVLSMPSLRVVAKMDGADATWVSAGTIAFRRGAQAMRLDVARPDPVTIGASQGTFGCTHESFGPATPCTSGRYTYLRGVDPALTTWLVEDSCMATMGAGGGLVSTCTPAQALRALDLTSGRSRTIASVPAHDDHLFVSVSPRATRVCAWTLRSDRASLTCALVDGKDSVEVLVAKKHGMLAWLDEDRVVVDLDDGGVVLVDLKARAIARITGLPEGAGWPTALPGGRRLVFARNVTWVVDLDAKTYTRGPAAAGPYDVDAAASNDARFVVREGRNGPFTVVDI